MNLKRMIIAFLCWLPISAIMLLLGVPTPIVFIMGFVLGMIVA
jgi:hypothetical protein